MVNNQISPRYFNTSESFKSNILCFDEICTWYFSFKLITWFRVYINGYFTKLYKVLWCRQMITVITLSVYIHCHGKKGRKPMHKTLWNQIKTTHPEGWVVFWKGCTNPKSFDFLTYVFEPPTYFSFFGFKRFYNFFTQN